MDLGQELCDKMDVPKSESHSGLTVEKLQDLLETFLCTKFIDEIRNKFEFSET